MRRPFAMLIALAAVLAAAAPASADEVSGTATATLSGSPDPVTAGTTVAYHTTFTNGTSGHLQNTTLDAPAPAGFTVLGVLSSGNCTATSGDATCTFGTLGAGASASATLLMQVPAATGEVSSQVTWTTSDGDHDSDDITLPAFTTVTVQAASADTAAAYVLPAGGTVSTGSATSAANPQSTTVAVPASQAGAATTLTEVDANGPQDGCGPGATCVGQISLVTVAAGPFSAADPLHLTFLLDSSELPRHFNKRSLKHLAMFHDGVAVPNCTGADGVASPDPCVSARKIIRRKHCGKRQFTVEIDVNSSTNGRWRA